MMWCKSCFFFACNVHICFHLAGLASIVKSPTNQTTCIGTSASFDCVISDSSVIFWLINGQAPGLWGVTSPATVPLFPGAKSTLILPGSLLFSGPSIVCSYGGIYSIPAFLTIQGISKPQLQMYLILSCL